MWFVISLIATVALLALKLTTLAAMPWWVVPAPVVAWLASVMVVIASFAISGYIILKKIWKAIKAYLDNQKTLDGEKSR